MCCRLNAIDLIRLASVHALQEWLTSMGIKYYESKMNLNWKPILKSITEVGAPLLLMSSQG